MYSIKLYLFVHETGSGIIYLCNNMRSLTLFSFVHESLLAGVNNLFVLEILETIYCVIRTGVNNLLCVISNYCYFLTNVAV